MTAATGRVFGPKPIHNEAIPHGFVYPLKASVAPFRNWLMGLSTSTGNAQAMAAAVANLVSLGFADQDQESSTTAGESKFMGRQQFVCGFPDSTESGDAILATDIAVACWAADNQTVGKLSNFGGSNRSLLGVAFGRDTDTDTAIFYPGPIGWLLGRSAHQSDNADRADLDIADTAAGDTIAERVMRNKRTHGVVTKIQLIGAAIAADNNDYITVTVSKRDGAGGGATVLGTYDSRAANQGAVTAFVPAEFALSAVAGALDLLETDIVTIIVAKGGAGKVITGTVRVIQKVG